MPHRPKLIYLLVDGAHARFIERSTETGALVTVRRMRGDDRLKLVRIEQRDEPAAGRSFESAGAARHGVGREDAYRRAKEGFVADVADKLRETLQGGDIDGVVVAAPSRLLGTLRAKLGDAPIVAELGKDLIKTPDHELEAWLGPLALAASA